MNFYLLLNHQKWNKNLSKITLKNLIFLNLVELNIYLYYTPKSKEELKEAIKFYVLKKEDGIKKYGIMNNWDVSFIEDMSCLFIDLKNFNENIGGWDVSNVRNMSYMFSDCFQFN